MPHTSINKMMLQATNLSVTISERMLVDQLNLQIAVGSCWAIIGANGAGKSTLLTTLCGLRQPATGELILNQKPYQQISPSERARLLSWLPQSHQRHDAFGYRAIDMVLASLRVADPAGYWDNAGHIDQALALLERLQTAPLAWRDMRRLSGGERQRVAIAATLAQRTPLLLMDEPESALDPAHRALLAQLLTEIRNTENRSILFSCHDLNLAWRCATHALILNTDGSWLGGPIHEVWNSASLSTCFGYQVKALTDGDATTGMTDTYWVAAHG